MTTRETKTAGGFLLVTKDEGITSRRVVDRVEGRLNPTRVGHAGTLDPSVPVVDAYQTMRFLSKATLIEVAGASHAPIGADDCTRGVAVAFLREPEAPADTSCMARRIAPQFALDGLDEFLNGDS